MSTKQEFLFGQQSHAIEVGDIVYLAQDTPFILDCGAEISQLPIAYQTFGTLNADKSNAVLICHALTGDQYVLGAHPVTGKAGWWELMVGVGKPIDTDKYFVICSNVIGSCMGSFGPKTINPATGKNYGLEFPVVTIGDMVRAQNLLLEYFGISQLFAVVGGSMGGMQVLEWAARYPEKVFSAVAVATTAQHSAQNIAFHEIGRQAIMADPDWCMGKYAENKSYPAKGLAVARMTAHVTYLSEVMLQQKFGRKLQNRSEIGYGFEADFQVESYLRYQGNNFVERFDPNAYLYITRAMDYFDIAVEHGQGSLAQAFAQTDTRFCIISFSSDWLFPTEESRRVVRALNAVAADVSFAEIQTDKGHDAFLLEVPEFYAAVKGFLDESARQRGI